MQSPSTPTDPVYVRTGSAPTPRPDCNLPCKACVLGGLPANRRLTHDGTPGTWQAAGGLLESRYPAKQCECHSARAGRREARTHGGRDSGGGTGHRNGGAQGPRLDCRRRRQCAKGLRAAFAALGLRRRRRGDGGRGVGKICELPARHADCRRGIAGDERAGPAEATRPGTLRCASDHHYRQRQRRARGNCARRDGSAISSADRNRCRK